MSISLRIKSKGGVTVVEASPTETIFELKGKISGVTGVPPMQIDLLHNYPPTPLAVPDNLTLEEAAIRSGETLIVQEKPPAAEPLPLPERPHTAAALLEQEGGCDSGILMRQVVPSDNSCLFTSIGFVLGGKVDPSCGTEMRKLIAEAVSSDQENYSEAILGKPNKEYCNWILKPESWGGGIELSVLTKHYGIEIAVIDTSNAIINRFGEDQNYEYRVFLIFDGIHYDPLYRETFEDGAPIQTMFSTKNEKVLHEAEELAREAKASRQFTDVNRFTLKCIECNTYLQGQVQAQQHAKSTGHTSFGEVDS